MGKSSIHGRVPRWKPLRTKKKKKTHKGGNYFSTSEDGGISKYDKYAKTHKSGRGKILLIGTVDNKSSLCIRETKKSKVIICLSSFTSVYLVIYLSYCSQCGWTKLLMWNLSAYFMCPVCLRTKATERIQTLMTFNLHTDDEKTEHNVTSQF